MSTEAIPPSLVSNMGQCPNCGTDSWSQDVQVEEMAMRNLGGVLAKLHLYGQETVGEARELFKELKQIQEEDRSKGQIMAEIGALDAISKIIDRATNAIQRSAGLKIMEAYLDPNFDNKPASIIIQVEAPE